MAAGTVTVELVSATFSPHVGEDFEIAPLPGEAFTAVLSACDETEEGSREAWLDSIGKVPFSLLFHAGCGVHHPQQIFALRHPALGDFELFLVPLGPDGRGMRYEAVVS